MSHLKKVERFKYWSSEELRIISNTVGLPKTGSKAAMCAALREHFYGKLLKKIEKKKASLHDLREECEGAQCILDEIQCSTDSCRKKLWNTCKLGESVKSCPTESCKWITSGYRGLGKKSICVPKYMERDFGNLWNSHRAKEYIQYQPSPPPTSI